MTTIKITVDDSLSFSKLQTALSLIHGITKIEVEKSSVDLEKKEYEQLKIAFLNSSKHSMAHQISKYIS
jgi:hypothetical protein